MNRKVSLGFTLALMLLVAAVTFTITFNFVSDRIIERVNDLREREGTQDKLAQIEREVRLNYNGTIDETTLQDSLARGYLAGIGDKYATYYDVRTYERRLSMQDNPVADIGALVQISADGYLQVEEVYPESPAQAAGILVSDLIVKIDDVDITAENSQAMLNSIQGELGTRILLTIRSGNVERTEELIRRVVAVPTVYSRMLDNNVGYIWIKEFGDSTSDQFRREREKMVGAGVQSIIFDVRGNSGGRLPVAYRILDSLLPEGPIASSIDKNGNIKILEYSDSRQLDLPMVVLVNGETASAAELFAQVLRDYDKARIVGTQSMGKGIDQALIPLTDGSAIEITVSKLITPGQIVFDEVGVKPDYDVGAEGWTGMHQSLLSLTYEDFISTDAQLKKAIEVAIALHRTGEALQSQAESEAGESGAESSQRVESSVPESSVPERSMPESSAPESSIPESSSLPPSSAPESSSLPPSSAPESSSPSSSSAPEAGTRQESSTSTPSASETSSPAEESSEPDDIDNTSEP